MATQMQLEVILARNRGNIWENVDPNSDEIIRAPPVEELKDTVLESLNQLNKSHTGGDNMRNASDHQCRMKTSGSEKKSERGQVRPFLQKNLWLRSFWKFHVVVVQTNGKEMYKKSVLHVPSCFFAN